MIDPMAILERTLQQILEGTPHWGVPANNGDTPAEELLTAVLADRLAGMIVDDESSTGADLGAGGYLSEKLAACEELVERNSAVAAALGACDCWGEDVHCPTCAGTGGPGWTVPDTGLFASYVHPAVRALKTSGALRPGSDHGQEDDGAERRASLSRE